MSYKDELKLEFLEYLLDHPKKPYREIPQNLKDKGFDQKDHNALAKEMGTKSDRKIFFDFAEKLRNKLKFPQEMELFNIQKNTQKKQTTLQGWQIGILIVQIVVTILLIWATLSIGNQANQISQIQTEISQIQTEILELSSIPNEAWIEIQVDPNDLNIPAWELTDKRNLQEKDYNDRWSEIDLSTFNFGRMDAHHIHCTPKANHSIFSIYTTPDSNFELNAGESHRTILHIAYTPCKVREECDRNSVPLGDHNITLKCTCIGCKTHSEFDEIIPICVWLKDEDKECSD